MKTWMYLQDPFLIETKHSFPTTLNISIFHNTALFTNKGDPFILGLYNSYHPLHLNYKPLYED